MRFLCCTILLAINILNPLSLGKYHNYLYYYAVSIVWS
jgi:hypothetical protein